MVTEGWNGDVFGCSVGQIVLFFGDLADIAFEIVGSWMVSD